MPDTVPLIDLDQARGSQDDRRRLARQIDDANSHIGFLAVVNHGISARLLDDMYDVTAEFFDSSEDQKMAVRARPGTSRGYMPSRSRALARTRGKSTPADLVEFFSIGLPDVPTDDPWFARARAHGHFHDNVWPAHPVFRDVWKRYYAEMAALAFDMMRLFALALDLDEHWFDDKVDKPISNLFANHYPPLDRRPEPGQLRIGEHTDYGSLTLLYQRDAVGDSRCISTTPGYPSRRSPTVLSSTSVTSWRGGRTTGGFRPCTVSRIPASRVRRAAGCHCRSSANPTTTP